MYIMNTYIFMWVYIYIYSNIYINMYIYVFKYMHMNIYIYTRIYIHMYVCIYSYTCMYTHIYICIYIYLYICIYIYIYMYMYTCIYVYIHVYIYIYINTYIYKYIYTYIRMYINTQTNTNKSYNRANTGLIKLPRIRAPPSSFIARYLNTQPRTDMGWLRLAGSFTLQVSFAEYSLFYRALLQKRPIILRSLLTVAPPYLNTQPKTTKTSTSAQILDKSSSHPYEPPPLILNWMIPQ